MNLSLDNKYQLATGKGWSCLIAVTQSVEEDGHHPDSLVGCFLLRERRKEAH
jgi:hypothetical protein